MPRGWAKGKPRKFKAVVEVREGGSKPFILPAAPMLVKRKRGPRPRKYGTSERMPQKELELDEAMERTRTSDPTMSLSKKAPTPLAESKQHQNRRRAPALGRWPSRADIWGIGLLVFTL